MVSYGKQQTISVIFVVDLENSKSSLIIKVFIIRVGSRSTGIFDKDRVRKGKIKKF
jgi:hypothetical protein